MRTPRILMMVSPRVAVALAVLLYVSAGLAVDFPNWWTSQGVVNNSSVSPDNFVAVNQGQLKNIALAAFKEFESRLPGGAGFDVTQVIDRFTQVDIVSGQRVPKTGTQTEDFAVVTLGQLKSIARPFYTRLEAVGLGNVFPWPAAGLSDDFAIANQGQLKRLFSFYVTDSDGDGIFDAWEQYYRLDANDPADASTDSDGDGISNLQEFHNRTSARDFFNAEIPIIEVVTGNGQSSEPLSLAPIPLTVRVTHQSGGIWPNAPVAFVPNANAGTVSSDGMHFSRRIVVRTDSTGNASVSWRFPNASSAALAVTASTGLQLSAVATFNGSFDWSITNFNATYSGSGRPTLTWSGYSNGEIAVKRRTRSGTTWTTVATASPGTTAYDDTNARIGKDYEYRLAFPGNAGDSTNYTPTKSPTPREVPRYMVYDLGDFIPRKVNSHSVIAGSINDRAAIWRGGQVEVLAGLPVDKPSRATFIDDQGRIAGYYENDSTHKTSFLWQPTETGQVITFTAHGFEEEPIARGITSSGEIFGSLTKQIDSQTVETTEPHCMLWDISTDEHLDLGKADYFTFDDVLKITFDPRDFDLPLDPREAARPYYWGMLQYTVEYKNVDGNPVHISFLPSGQFTTGGVFVPRACKWGAGPAIELFPQIAKNGISNLIGQNSSGVSILTTSTVGGSETFLIDSAGYRSLGPLSATDINETSAVVGKFKVRDEANFFVGHPFVLDQESLFELPLVTGYTGVDGGADPTAINDAAQIVGMCGDSLEAFWSARACLWQDRQVYDLEQLAVNASDWTLNELFDIGNDGTVIGLGFPSYLEGESTFFVALPIVVDSMDRYVFGSLPVTPTLNIEFVRRSDGQVIARYDHLAAAMDATDHNGENFHVYGSEDEIFDLTEASQISSGSPDALRFESPTVFVKKDNITLHFALTLEQLSNIDVKLYDGSTLLVTLSEDIVYDGPTFAALVQTARTLAQVHHLPTFPDVIDLQRPYEDHGDDYVEPSLGILQLVAFLEATDAAMVPEPSAGSIETLPNEVFSEVHTSLKARVKNVVAKVFLPFASMRLGTVDSKKIDANLAHMQLSYMQGMTEGFSAAIGRELENVAHTAGTIVEVQKLTSDPLAALYRGFQIYDATVRLAEDIRTAGGMKAYVDKAVNNFKTDVEEAFDWVLNGPSSEFVDAFILGYGSGYITESIAVGLFSTLATDGEAAMAKAVSMVRQGAAAFALFSLRAKLELRLLMWLLKYGRLMQITYGVASSEGLAMFQEVREVGGMLRQLAKTRSMYGTAGGTMQVLAERVTRVDELAKAVALANRSANGIGDWFRTGAVMRELATFAEAMDANPADVLSVSSLRGYAKLGHSMAFHEVNNGVHGTRTTGLAALRNYLAGERDYTVLPNEGSLPAAKANAVLELFDNNPDLVLGADGHTWTYKGTIDIGPIRSSQTGLLYDEEHRVAHVLHHMIRDEQRRNGGRHGVFTISFAEVLEKIYLTRTTGTPLGGPPTVRNFTLDFGPNTIIGETNNGMPALNQYKSCTIMRAGFKLDGRTLNTSFPE
jgi:hypothetical protein